MTYNEDTLHSQREIIAFNRGKSKGIKLGKEIERKKLLDPKDKIPDVKKYIESIEEVAKKEEGERILKVTNEFIKSKEGAEFVVKALEELKKSIEVKE